MPVNIEHASDDLKLALRSQSVVSGFDDPDPELLGAGVEEEEEEEEVDDLDPDLIEVDDGDRGDSLDPDMTDEEPDPDDELDEGGEPESNQGRPVDDLDPELLAEVAGGDKPKAVPYGRFADVNNALKAEREVRLRLEEELARARGSAPAPVAEPEKKPEPAYDFDEAEERYADALMEGDKALAKQIRTEIRAEERKQFEQSAAEQAQKLTEQDRLRTNEQLEAERLQVVVSKAVAQYPFLDAQDVHANQDAIDDVVAHRDLLIKRGISPSQALEQAVAKVGPRYAEPEKATPHKPVLGKETIERNVQRQSQFPSAPGGVGERGKDIDYAKLSEDEFDALSEADKRRARGDFVSEKA